MSRYGKDEELSDVENEYPSPVFDFVPDPPMPSTASSFVAFPLINISSTGDTSMIRTLYYCSSEEDEEEDWEDDSDPDIIQQSNSEKECKDMQDNFFGLGVDTTYKTTQKSFDQGVEGGPTLSDMSLKDHEYTATLCAGKIHVLGIGQELFQPVMGAVTPEIERIKFHYFLRRSGILSLIARSLLNLYDMEDRPEPERALEFMITSLGYNILLRQAANEAKAMNQVLTIRKQRLEVENDWLHRALDRYESSETEIVVPDTCESVTVLNVTPNQLSLVPNEQGQLRTASTDINSGCSAPEEFKVFDQSQTADLINQNNWSESTLKSDLGIKKDEEDLTLDEINLRLKLNPNYVSDSDSAELDLDDDETDLDDDNDEKERLDIILNGQFDDDLERKNIQVVTLLTAKKDSDEFVVAVPKFHSFNADRGTRLSMTLANQGSNQLDKDKEPGYGLEHEHGIDAVAEQLQDHLSNDEDVDDSFDRSDSDEQDSEVLDTDPEVELEAEFDGNYHYLVKASILAQQKSEDGIEFLNDGDYDEMELTEEEDNRDDKENEYIEEGDWEHLQPIEPFSSDEDDFDYLNVPDGDIWDIQGPVPLVCTPQKN